MHAYTSVRFGVNRVRVCASKIVTFAIHGHVCTLRPDFLKVYDSRVLEVYLDWSWGDTVFKCLSVRPLWDCKFKIVGPSVLHVCSFHLLHVDWSVKDSRFLYEVGKMWDWKASVFDLVYIVSNQGIRMMLPVQLSTAIDLCVHMSALDCGEWGFRSRIQIYGQIKPTGFQSLRRRLSELRRNAKYTWRDNNICPERPKTTKMPKYTPKSWGFVSACMELRYTWHVQDDNVGLSGFDDCPALFRPMVGLNNALIATRCNWTVCSVWVYNETQCCMYVVSIDSQYSNPQHSGPSHCVIQNVNIIIDLTLEERLR